MKSRFSLLLWLAATVFSSEACNAQSEWQWTEEPPVLNLPRLIDVSKVEPTTVPAFGLHCSGLVTRISLGNAEDALIFMTGSLPLRYPLHVTGGRNVRVVGLQMELETQPGCGVGELPNHPVNVHPDANIHPRIPAGIAMRMQQSGVTFVEGAHLDLKGHETDCFVSRNPDSMDNATARAQRDFIIQNTLCTGIEGMGRTDIGDGVHGDFFQNQGAPQDVLRRVVMENVSVRTSQEGIVLQPGGGDRGAVELVLRRFDYAGDTRYIGDDPHERFGLAFDAYADNWEFLDVYIDDPADRNYGKVNGQRYGELKSKDVLSHLRIRSGLPIAGAYALAERTGLNYASPHGGVPSAE